MKLIFCFSIPMLEREGSRRIPTKEKENHDWN
jgi:hypothetical protein